MAVGSSRKSAAIYRIEVQGALGEGWADWFGDLCVDRGEEGLTVLTGSFLDQAALFGVLKRIRDLGMPLLSLTQVERMDPTVKTSRVLGIAFLLQFVTSLSSGAFLKSSWYVPGNMSDTLIRIATNPLVMRANVLMDVLTALGVAFLGSILFLVFRKQSEKIALTALAFYLLEAALLAASRLEAYSLLRISQEYVATGRPDYMLTMGTLAYESMDFVGNTLHMLAFCLGALLFYLLLHKARVVPGWMSLWGLITVFPMLVGTISQIFGYTIPIFFYVPYVPFELVIGVWILARGIVDADRCENSATRG